MLKDEGLNWWGWFNPRSGYGIVNLEYSTALERLMGKVSIGWERQVDMLSEDYDQLSEEQKALLAKPYKKERVGVIKVTPQLFYQNKSDFRIGYTMVENTKIGPKWVDLCNAMDAIFVPNKFLIDIFKECGVKPPVYSVKQGVDSRKFPYVDRSLKDKFVFGTVGYQDDRKNWQDLVKAFSSEFAQNEPVELWIKNSNQYFASMAFKDTRIKVINRQYSFNELQRLYSMFDCFVFPSHAEGSGLPPREAMACFVPETEVSLDTEIQKKHKRRYEGKLIIIKSGNNIVKATPNHPFLTKRGWVEAGHLTTRDSLYILTKYDKKLLDKGRIGDIGKELPTHANEGFAIFNKENKMGDSFQGKRNWVEKIISCFYETAQTLSNRDGKSIFSRSYGWRGDFNFQRRQKTQQNYSYNTDFEYRFKDNKFFKNQNRTEKLLFAKGKKIAKKKNSIYLLLERIFDFKHFRSVRTLSFNQKGALWNFDFIHQKQNDNKSGYTKLFRERKRLLKADKSIECQGIERITFEDYKGFVYNLTTSDGIYFANGFLVHNCGLPVILTDWSGLSEVCDTRFNYPLSPVAIDIPDVRGPDQPGFMARIDIEELMYWMRYVYEHPYEAKNKGKLASQFVHSEWSWDSCATDIWKTLQTF